MFVVSQSKKVGQKLQQLIQLLLAMSWNKFIEDNSVTRQNRFAASEDSLQFSDNKLGKHHFEDSLNQIAVGFITPIKNSPTSNNAPVSVEYHQIVELLELINNANSKIQQLERRLSDKPAKVETGIQTEPTKQMQCLRKIAERLNQE